MTWIGLARFSVFLFFELLLGSGIEEVYDGMHRNFAKVAIIFINAYE